MRLSAPSCLCPLVLLLVAVACGGGQGAQKAKSAATSKPPQKAEAPGDPTHNLLRNMDFSTGSMLPWITTFTTPTDGAAKVKNGALCVEANVDGTNLWEAQVRHRDMVLQQGHDYVVSFKAWASKDVKLTTQVGMAGPPQTTYWSANLTLAKSPQQFAYKFKMDQPDDPTVEFALHFASNQIKGKGRVEVCFDDLILSDPAFKLPVLQKSSSSLPRLRVNQVGYIPNFAKWAVLVSDARTPLEFRILDATKKVVHNGKTAVHGPDVASGDNLHQIDFSSFTAPGKGYFIQVGQDISDPFDIDQRLYRAAKYHAFRYFYLNRSGIELKLPYTRKSDWARPAGHPKDEAPCNAAAKCNYSVDATGGWYDAGDYGKYVVNGGITVWTLMNWYERTSSMKGDANAFGDLNEVIPESGNKIPDILDEVRWEIEFMLRMQIPEGQPLQGMVHHKVHGVEVTPLGTGPHEDQAKRELYGASTAATLNLAAAAAQAARLFKDFDPAFADRCLRAAEAAWEAARKSPSVLVVTENAKGGKSYGDADVDDEFYWAAAELWVTTGKANYKKELELSPLDKDIGGADVQSFFTWQRISGLGKISMALSLPKSAKAARERYRQQLVRVAEQYVKVTQTEGYKLSFSAGKSKEYPLSSNALVMNNALVLALAHDLTRQPKYRDAAVMSVDYVLGRNAMAVSYVTLLGERPVANLHHRFWAHQAKAKYPAPPPGVLSGGPNSALQDPYVAAAGLIGCKPQKCYLDHSQASSVNEVNIDANAPLMWVLAWIDEQAAR